MKIIIIGIGNPILGDDGIGIHIARTLRTEIDPSSDIFIDEAQTGGMNLLDSIRGYDKAILIDAVCLNDLAPGQVRRFDVHDMETVHSCNPHDLSLKEAIDLSRTIGDDTIPRTITIIGINLRHIPTEFSECISPEIQKVIPEVVQMVISEIKDVNTNNSTDGK
jgi:hydrogenase maturation protease